MSSDRAFRFGVTMSSGRESLSTWRDSLHKAEDLGYSTVLFTDHMGRQAAPLIAAMAALSETTRIRVGTQVLASPFRNPAVLAKEIASLSYFSGGRFEVGLGAGWPTSSRIGRSDAEQTGIDMGAAGPRVERFGEVLHIVKEFLARDAPLDFEGRYFKIKGLEPFPLTAPELRAQIMVAGAGPRMLRLAALEADIVNLSPRLPTRGMTAFEQMGFGMNADAEIQLIKSVAGARYADIELCVFSNNTAVGNPSITAQPETALEELAQTLGTTAAVVSAMPTTLIGSFESLVDRLHMHRDLYDISYRIVPESAMESFAPLVARLAGS